MVRYFLTDLRGNPIYSFAQRLRRNNRQQQQHTRLSQQLAQTMMQHTSSASFATTTLVCMIRNRAWEDVLKRVVTHPDEVQCVELATGNTVLHTACRLNPPSAVVQALATSMSARQANREGATPLHILASHRCSRQALQALLDACHSLGNLTPENSIGDDRDDDKHTSPTADLSRMGRAPIHYACMSFRGLEMDAFSFLLDATLKEGNVWVQERDDRLEDFDEEFDCGEDENDEWDLYQQMDGELKVLVNVMGLKDATGQTPLGLLFRRYRERVRCVITTVDRLRSQQDSPDRAALVAAVRVHADLGELWEKARWIVARLTEERLQREDDECEADPLPKITRFDATSRRTKYYGSNILPLCDRFVAPPSPGEKAVSKEAASWAVEQHPVRDPSTEDMLPLAPNVSTVGAGRTLNQESPSTGRQFRIVHASVGLTGYGCPPELIRLAISIHPHQVTEMDEDGNLPLHIAVTAASYLATASAADHPLIAAAASAVAADTGDDHSVLSDAAMSFFSSATVSQTTNPFDKVIKILLQQYPHGARMPQGKTGRLPLVLAVESSRRTWKDGIRTLLNAYPPALHNKKIIEPELYPTVLALVANNGVTGCAFDFAESCGLVVDDVIDETSVSGGGGGVSPRQSTRAIRHEACSRTTLFELLRTKPEWLTRGFDFDSQ